MCTLLWLAVGFWDIFSIVWQCCSTYLHKCNRYNAVLFCRLGHIKGHFIKINITMYLLFMLFIISFHRKIWRGIFTYFIISFRWQFSNIMKPWKFFCNTFQSIHHKLAMATSIKILMYSSDVKYWEISFLITLLDTKFFCLLFEWNY